MDRPPKPESFILTLAVPKADDSGAAFRRLRALLKTAWRSFGLKCVRVVAGGAVVTADEIREDGP